jgi:hypothetical protein
MLSFIFKGAALGLGLLAMTSCQRTEPESANKSRATTEAGLLPAASSPKNNAPAPNPPASTASSASSSSSAAIMAAAAKPSVPVSGSSGPTESAPPGSCQLAKQVLYSCVGQETCNADITLYLPSAARSQLGYLTQKPWFGSDAFDKYCEAVCNAKSANVDEKNFADEVCGAHLPRPAKAQKSKASRNMVGLRIAIGDDLVLADRPVALQKVLQRLGQPTKIAKSKFECGSAFESDNTMEYTFADASFEVNGQEAVLRWARIGSTAKVLLPPKAGVSRLAIRYSVLSLPGYMTLSLEPDVVRIGLRPGEDLSRTFDFRFVDDQIAEVKLWIAC